MRLSASHCPEILAFAREGRIVFVDTETTGCAAHDEICQIAAVEYVRGVLTREFAVYVNPTCEMNPFAEQIHGLSPEFLALNGLDPSEAMRQFAAFFGEGALFVAHNVPFDKKMVERECAKFGVPFDFRGVRTCDTLALSRRLRPGLRKHTLSAMIEALGIAGVNSHDALDDVRACAGVFFALVTELPA